MITTTVNPVRVRSGWVMWRESMTSREKENLYEIIIVLVQHRYTGGILTVKVAGGTLVTK
jgi:hypothetical protein